MNYPDNVVSVHPYFKVLPGKLAKFRALIPKLVAKASTEKATLYYEYTANGDDYFVREAYVGAEGWQAHMSHLAGLIDELMTLTTLTRLEIHGPAAELDKLRSFAANMKPVWFVRDSGSRSD